MPVNKLPITLDALVRPRMSLPIGSLNNQYSLSFQFWGFEVLDLGFVYFATEWNRLTSLFVVGTVMKVIYVLAYLYFVYLTFSLWIMTRLFFFVFAPVTLQHAHVIIGEIKVQIHTLSGLFTADMHVYLSNTGIYPPPLPK